MIRSLCVHSVLSLLQDFCFQYTRICKGKLWVSIILNCIEVCDIFSRQPISIVVFSSEIYPLVYFGDNV